MADGGQMPCDLFSNLVQIGVVVRDLDKTVDSLATMLGVGPFRTIAFPPDDRPDIQRSRKYRGREGGFKARIAFTSLGPLELEIIQPLEGESVWSEFLENHGEGLHHIRFNVEDMGPVITHMVGLGVSPSQEGGGLRPGTSFAYFDTESKVGFTIEVLKAVAGTDGRTPDIVDGRVVV